MVNCRVIGRLVPPGPPFFPTAVKRRRWASGEGDLAATLLRVVPPSL
jgi:hypothetical protein